MNFFLDTGDIEEIKQAKFLGIVDGITTNPSIIAKTGRPQIDVIKEISTLIEGPISAEVISLKCDEMVKEGLELKKIHKNIVIKLPVTIDGISACKILSDQGIQTNLTLCFSANQALLAAKNGATYISPFIGRIDDTGHDGLELISDIRQVYDNYKFKTKILAASVRNGIHVKECALIGADVATMGLATMKSLYHHPLTNIGLEQFIRDHELSKNE